MSQMSSLPLLPMFWGVAMVGWMYAPLTQQNRYALGIQPCLAILAVGGMVVMRDALAKLLARLSIGRPSIVAARVVAYASLVLASGTGLYVFCTAVASAATNQPLRIYALDQDTYKLALWLSSGTSSDDVVLASPAVSNALAGFIPGRVVAGHPAITLRYQQRVSDIEAAYRGQLTDAELIEFLQANHVTYMVESPEERTFGGPNPGRRLGFPIAHLSGEAVAYQVAR